MEDEAGQLIVRAIQDGARAGVFRRAARLNPASKNLWDRLAAPHSARAASILQEVCDRQGEGPSRSSCFGDE